MAKLESRSILTKYKWAGERIQNLSASEQQELREYWRKKLTKYRANMSEESKKRERERCRVRKREMYKRKILAGMKPEWDAPVGCEGCEKIRWRGYPMVSTIAHRGWYCTRTKPMRKIETKECGL